MSQRPVPVITKPLFSMYRAVDYNHDPTLPSGLTSSAYPCHLMAGQVAWWTNTFRWPTKPAGKHSVLLNWGHSVDASRSLKLTGITSYPKTLRPNQTFPTANRLTINPKSFQQPQSMHNIIRSLQLSDTWKWRSCIVRVSFLYIPYVLEHTLIKARCIFKNKFSS